MLGADPDAWGRVGCLVLSWRLGEEMDDWCQFRDLGNRQKLGANSETWGRD